MLHFFKWYLQTLLLQQACCRWYKFKHCFRF